MAEETNITISTDILENLYKEFVDFIKIIANEDFVSFKSSNYVDQQENYKYSIYREAKRYLGNKDWKLEQIGKGEIQRSVHSAIVKNANHNHKSYDNNLIYWIQKDNFSKISRNKDLEQLFFDFYKTKISNQKAFEGLMEYFDYQLIAYLFFIKDYNQFLPISQEIFDDVISQKLHIPDFKTSRRISWENYKTFLDINKQAYRFLRTKDKNATLLDAHSFLWILGKQREDWLSKSSSSIEQTTISKNVRSTTTPETKQHIPLIVSTEIAKTQKTEMLAQNNNVEKKRFTPIDIIWVKNVTDHNLKQAYMNLSDEELGSVDITI